MMRKYVIGPANDRFDAWVEPELNTGCQLWSGASNGKGDYGVFNRGDGVMVSAHKFSFERHYGPVPAGMVVMHKCDTPRCVNHQHLRAGTSAENSQEIGEKGRRNDRPMHGEENARAKLTEEQAREVKGRALNGENLRRLAHEFGVSAGMIGHIKSGRAWKCLEIAP